MVSVLNSRHLSWSSYFEFYCPLQIKLSCGQPSSGFTHLHLWARFRVGHNPLSFWYVAYIDKDCNNRVIKYRARIAFATLEVAGKLTFPERKLFTEYFYCCKLKGKDYDGPIGFIHIKTFYETLGNALVATNSIQILIAIEFEYCCLQYNIF